MVVFPSFARGPGNSVDLPNSRDRQPGGHSLNLSDGAGVTSGQFVLQYNSALLAVTGVTVNGSLAGASLTLDPSSTPGKAVLDFFSPTALAPGIASLGALQAGVPNSAAASYKAKALLHFASEQLNGGAIAVAGDDALQIVAYLGDTNGDGTLSGGDASLISRVSVIFDTGFAAYPLLDPAIVGDLSNNGQADGPDVTLVNSYLAGIYRPQVPLIPTGLIIVPTGPDPILSLPAGLQAIPGTTLTVPVDIDTAHPDGSTGATEAILALKYDPQIFTVSAADVQLGSLTTGWQLTTVVNSQTGEIGIDLFSSMPIQSIAGGSLVTIAMEEKVCSGPCAVGSNAGSGSLLPPLSLVPQVDPTGQRVFTTTVGDGQGAFVLHISSGQWAASDGQAALGNTSVKIDNSVAAAPLTNGKPKAAAHLMWSFSLVSHRKMAA